MDKKTLEKEREREWEREGERESDNIEKRNITILMTMRNLEKYRCQPPTIKTTWLVENLGMKKFVFMSESESESEREREREREREL